MSFTVRATRDPANGHATPVRPASSYVMAFGKHKGQTIDTVPESWLRWAIRECAMLDNDPALRAEIEMQLGMLPGSTRVAPEEEMRVLRVELAKEKAHRKVAEEELTKLRRRTLTLQTTVNAMRANERPAVINKAPKVEALRGIVKGLYRRLTLQHHPDRGGSAEAMKIVVELFRTLDEELSKWEKT